MDMETVRHLSEWLDRYYGDRVDEKLAAFDKIVAVLFVEPELVNTHTWPEILHRGEDADDFQKSLRGPLKSRVIKV